MSWNNDEVIQAMEGLNALSKIGTKDKATLKRLAKMIIWAKAAAQEFIVQRDTLTHTWAEKDDADEIKVKTGDDGKSQIPVFRNGVEFNLAVNELLRSAAKFEGDPPDPFAWADLDRFQKPVDAAVIASLGPFITID